MLAIVVPPSPLEWFKGLAVGSYHVDSPEGLKALADTIKKIVELQTQSQEIQFLTKLADLIDQYDACIGYSLLMMVYISQ